MPVTDQTPEVMLFDTNGVEVPVANGVAIPLGTRGIIAAGSDGANTRFVSVDTSGRQLAVGPSAVGAAVAGAPVLAGGSDGANARYLLVDVNGRQIAVGAAASGAAVAGNPVLTAGSDGANARSLLVDASGRQIAVGAAAAGAAPVGNPVLVSGSDGALVRTLLLDTGGRAFVKLTDGVNVQAVKAASTAPVAADPAAVVVLSPNQQAIPVTSTPNTAAAGSRGGLVALSGGTSGSANAVRATVYNEQTVNAQRSISSSSANDTAAGTGARTVQITYYTATMTGPFTETVTMNGATPVNTVNTNICFIESMVVLTSGSLNTNAGVITLFVSTGGGGGAISSIGVGALATGQGDGRTLWAQHYVGVGKTLSLTALVVGASAQTTFFVRSKDPTLATSSEIPVFGSILVVANEFQRTFGSPPSVIGPARLTIYGVPSTNNVTMNGTFDFYEQ